jgi:hypothetical protein
MKKILTILLCIIIYTPYEYYSGEFIKSHFSYYESVYSFVDVSLDYTILSTVDVLLVLLFSFLIRKKASGNSIIKIGIKIGLLYFAIWFLFFSFVSFGSYNFPLVFSFGLAHFIIGFTFPLIYKWLNKKQLFNENFY